MARALCQCGSRSHGERRSSSSPWNGEWTGTADATDPLVLSPSPPFWSSVMEHIRTPKVIRLFRHQWLGFFPPARYCLCLCVRRFTNFSNDTLKSGHSSPLFVHLSSLCLRLHDLVSSDQCVRHPQPAGLYGTRPSVSHHGQLISLLRHRNSSVSLLSKQLLLRGNRASSWHYVSDNGLWSMKLRFRAPAIIIITFLLLYSMTQVLCHYTPAQSWSRSVTTLPACWGHMLLMWIPSSSLQNHHHVHSTHKSAVQ